MPDTAKRGQWTGTRAAIGIRGASAGTATADVLGKDDWEAPRGCSCKSCSGKGPESYNRNLNFLQRKTITKSVHKPTQNTCGSWLACDKGNSMRQSKRGDAIAGKPAPTQARSHRLLCVVSAFTRRTIQRQNRMRIRHHGCKGINHPRAQ